MPVSCLPTSPKFGFQSCACLSSTHVHLVNSDSVFENKPPASLGLEILLVIPYYGAQCLTHHCWPVNVWWVNRIHEHGIIGCFKLSPLEKGRLTTELRHPLHFETGHKPGHTLYSHRYIESSYWAFVQVPPKRPRHATLFSPRWLFFGSQLHCSCPRACWGSIHSFFSLKVSLLSAPS